MAAPLDPPALDQLVDLAERSRVDDWSFRSALVRYAQPEPNRVASLLSLVRRWEAAVHERMAVLRKDGARYLAAAGDEDDEKSAGDDELDPILVGLLRVARDLDGLGEVAAAWAVDREGQPGPEIDAAIERVAAALDELGVAEEQPIPRGVRGRG